MADDGRYNSGNTGLVLGALAGGLIGYSKWGLEGLLLGLAGALIGMMGETALTAGRAGRSSLLLALVPLAAFGIIAWVVYRYFRRW